MAKQIYVKMDGRLGNQMFQYAFGRQMQEYIGGELILDFTSHRINSSKRIYGDNGMCNSLVHFNVKPYTYVDLGNYQKERIPVIQRILFKIARFLKPMTKRQWWIEIFEFLDHAILQHFGVFFLESVNPVKYLKWPSAKKENIFIRSWAESEKFFSGISEQLREEFTPLYPIPKKFENLYYKLQTNESVCVSIRRGDFTSSTFSSRYLVCNIDYYQKGIAYLNERLRDMLIYVCSDDIDWCIENIHFEGNVIFEPKGMEIWDKVRFMSACHHFIISNSTFSWWCQYLSPYKDKIVIAPPKWRIVYPAPKDIYQKNWTILD